MNPMDHDLYHNRLLFSFRMAGSKVVQGQLGTRPETVAKVLIGIKLAVGRTQTSTDLVDGHVAVEFESMLIMSMQAMFFSATPHLSPWQRGTTHPCSTRRSGAFGRNSALSGKHLTLKKEENRCRIIRI